MNAVSSDLKIFFGVLFLPVVLSCSPTYLPNSVNAPLLSNKGELQTDFHFGSSGTDIQAAIGITNHIGLMVNTSFAKRFKDDDDWFHRHRYAEIALGYYYPITQSARFEIFGGIGKGKVTRRNVFDQITPETIEASGFFTKGFLQIDIGGTSDYLDGGLSLRHSLVNFFRYEDANYISYGNENGFFVEPALFLQVGYGNVKLSSEIGLSLPYNNIEFDASPFFFNIGVNFQFFKDDDLNSTRPSDDEEE